MPLLSTTTSNFSPDAFEARSQGSDQVVLTPKDVSSGKYEKGGFCIFLSSLSPTTFSVTWWPCCTSVLASQNPMFAWPPPLVFTINTFRGETVDAAEVWGAARMATRCEIWNERIWRWFFGRNEEQRAKETKMGAVRSGDRWRSGSCPDVVSVGRLRCFRVRDTCVTLMNAGSSWMQRRGKIETGNVKSRSPLGRDADCVGNETIRSRRRRGAGKPRTLAPRASRLTARRTRPVPAGARNWWQTAEADMVRCAWKWSERCDRKAHA